MPGRLVLQDLAHVLESADLPSEIDVQAHSFFDEQPIKHAKAYYLRTVLHDWPDKQAVQIPASTITAKGVPWPLEQILVDSPYKDRFANGLWLHGFLNVDDYHRLPAQVAGTVLEVRVIAGQNSMQVRASCDMQGVWSDGAACSAFNILFQTGF